MGISGKSFSTVAMRVSLVPLAMVITVFSMPLTASAIFDGSQYTDQITALENQIGQFQEETIRLQGQADTLENKIATITNQTQTLQAQIDLNTAKHEQLSGQIMENQTELDRQKAILGNTLGKLYVDSSVSSIEVLAGSKTIGDFMDKQQYRSGIRDKMKNSITTVKALKEELNAQKQDVELIVADQKVRNQQLAVQKAEQAQLLESTRGEEAGYRTLINEQKKEIEAVKEEQATAYAAYEQKYQLELKQADEARAAAEARAQEQATQNNSSGGQVGPSAAVAVAPQPSGGTYPAIWANSPQDSLVDSWGMYNRECVSYTAWKVADSGRYMPYWGGKGHAYQWPANARAAGIGVGSSPSVGSIAVWGIEDIGGVGHTAYVEAVYEDGSILVSQYNWGVRGSYSEMVVPVSLARSLEYIYF